MADTDYPHIFLHGHVQTSRYTKPKRGMDAPAIPDRDPASHGAFLRRRFSAAWRAAQMEELQRKRLAVSLPDRRGAYLEFRSEPGFDLALGSLEGRREGVRLLSVRSEVTDGTTYATVFIPHGKESWFLNRVEKYLTERTEKGLPKHRALLDTISDIQLAVLRSFWTDDPSLFPSGEEEDWFEIWLSATDGEVEDRFRSVLQGLQIQSRPEILVFPERSVLIVRAQPQQLAQLVQFSDDIAEVRKAKEIAQFFVELQNADQVEWAEDLLERLRIDPGSEFVVCILDTGVNEGHMLLAPVLDSSDCQAVKPDWGSNDHEGHGTLMAGLASYGDLRHVLETGGDVIVPHRLESVKIWPPRGEKNEPELYGYVTAEGVSRAEIQAPERQRVICMAVTTIDSRDRGQPSSWSAELDALSAGSDDDQKRLFVLSAGNVEPGDLGRAYPAGNMTDGIHDPGQSWNALTVGAHTWKTDITAPDCADYHPLAPAGGLSPFSTTSLVWEKKWPAKPDIVMEGGNAAVDSSGFCSELDDLSLLSTSHLVTSRQFEPFSMTSAAAAQAARMAIQIQAAYPEAWPETLRALMVHSAQWTDAMRSQFLTKGNKTDYGNLLKICGYGAPDLGRALHCATNSLTLIAQEEIQPYGRNASGTYCTQDMHLHELPWPGDVLLGLGEIPVTMRLTLSYFVEPGPGRIGWRDRYRYASHALRFDVNSPEESRTEFEKRLNQAAREEGEKPDTNSGSGHWVIGKNGRDRGSIHSDIWEGTGAELAASNLVGVYPIIGWWCKRAHLGRWNRKARYSLIISIHTPEQSVDIYTPVAIQTRVAVPIQIPTN